MSSVEQVEKLAEEFEKHLGAPHDPANAVSFATALDHDDRETYSHEGMAHLQEWGFPAYLVPTTSGGSGTCLQDTLELFRLLARRDAGLGTSMAATALGYMPVWVAGSIEQKERYGRELARGAAFSWGLSERDHGSDIMATGTCARRVEGGYLLDGEKWPIGNSALGEFAAIFARTGDRGPMAYSVFMLDRRAVPSRCASPMPRERLQGIRSIDNGGLRLTECFVPDSALIGQEGHGLEVALKASMVARAFAPTMALGCADTALRLTLDFAVQREIFNKRIAEVPYTRRKIASCFADVMVADALAVASCRALQVVPEQCSVTSSVVKFFVPTSLERTVSELATVLGARHYLRSDPHYGMFGKAMRDLWISHFAEGNTVVNLKNIAMQLPQLAAAALEAPTGQRETAARDAELIYNLDAELPELDPSRLDLRSRDGDSTLIALPAALEILRANADRTDGADREMLLAAAGLGSRFLDELAGVRHQDAVYRESMGPRYSDSHEVLELAERYCAIHAAAALVHLATRSAASLREPLPDPAVLVLGLARLWQRFHPLDDVAGPEVVDAVAGIALRLHAEGRSFSHRRLLLAEGGRHLEGSATR